MSNNDDSVRWSVMNPYGHEVVLRQETYDSHVVGDHDNSDAKMRKAIEEQAKIVIQSPSVIYEEEDHVGRYKYKGLITIPCDNNQMKLCGLLAIVDTDRTPHELVTWMAQNKVKDTLPEKGVVYDVYHGIIG